MPSAVISSVVAGSPAHEAGLLTGDELLRINGREPTDIIEYQQLVDGERVVLVLRRAGEALDRKVTIEKQAGAPLGLSVESAVFDRIRTCDNHCSFCFIYQLPKGMRRSLYVKDDDFRLSFLYGNYTTLTRFTEFDLERVIEERLSPLYVSIHTTDPQLRARMLRNPRGATSLRWLSELLKAGIEVHGQVVVCPGVNDGEALVRTIEDVITDYPSLASLSLVPLGLSRHSNEEDMRAPTPQDARDVIAIAEELGAVAREVLGRQVVFASDEFHLIAGDHPPVPEDLDAHELAENGVGMIAAFEDSFLNRTAMTSLGTGFFQSVDGAPAEGYRAPRGGTSAVGSGPVTILTGEYAAPILRKLLDAVNADHVEIVPVVNEFFGGNIKVAGLLTGEDLTRTINRLGTHRHYVIADVMLSEGRFLDGMMLEDLPGTVSAVETTGTALRELIDASERGAS